MKKFLFALLPLFAAGQAFAQSDTAPISAMPADCSSNGILFKTRIIYEAANDGKTTSSPTTEIKNGALLIRSELPLEKIELQALSGELLLETPVKEWTEKFLLIEKYQAAPMILRIYRSDGMHSKVLPVI